MAAKRKAAPKRSTRRALTKAPRTKRVAARVLETAAAVAASVVESVPVAPEVDKKLLKWRQIRLARDAHEAASLEAIQARQAKSPPAQPLPQTDAEWDALIRLLPGFDPYALAGDCEFVPEAAAHAIEFIEKHVRHHEGDLGGQLLRMEPWQRAFVANLFGWLKPDGITRRFHDAFLYVGKKNGKALALDTRIPTPSGWSTMWDLAVGDEVFDERGIPCRVVATTPVMRGRPCFRVTFDDGTSIVADAAHEWYTDAYRTGRPGPSKGVPREATKQTFRDHIRTTRQIADTLTFHCGGPAGVASNHSIPNAGPLHTSNVELPIEPYTLGAWLGDGSSNCAQMTCAMVDYQIIDEINADGYESGAPAFHKKESPGTATVTLTPGVRGHRGSSRLRAALSSVGVKNNKHIPAAYLRASEQQRMSLLQGLMDTDGYVSATGQCTFTTTTPALRDGVLELLRTLGYKPTLRGGVARVNGIDCGPKWDIGFGAHADRPCFRLARKVARLRPAPAGRARSTRRQIVSVEPVESVPVRCVEVDSPTHMYLAGDAMVPTHNSLLCEGIALYLFLGDGEFGAKVYCAAAKRDQARIIWDGCLWQIKNDPELDQLCERYQYTITKTDSGFLKPISADADKEDGMNPSGFVMDEVHRQPDSRLASMAKKSMKTRRNHLYVGLTTSGEDGESFVNDELARFKAVRDNKGDPLKPGHFPDMLPAIYEADEGDDWTKPATWRKANPSLGVSIPIDEIEKECRAAVESPALVADFLRYRLNMRVKTTSAMFDMRAWDKCGAPIDPRSLHGKRCWIGIDLSSTTDITAQVALFEDGSVLCWFWVPEEAARVRDKRNDGLYLGWARAGFLTLTHGDQIDEERVLTEMIENARPFKVVEWDFDPYSASRFTQRLQAEGVAVVSVRQGSWTMSEPLKALTVMVGNGTLKHGGHPVLRWMASNAEREIDKKDNWTLTKPKGFLKIDGISALATAKTRAMVAPAVVEVAPFTATFIPWKRNVG